MVEDNLIIPNDKTLLIISTTSETLINQFGESKGNSVSVKPTTSKIEGTNAKVIISIRISCSTNGFLFHFNTFKVNTLPAIKTSAIPHNVSTKNSAFISDCSNNTIVITPPNKVMITIRYIIGKIRTIIFLNDESGIKYTNGRFNS